MGHRATDWPSGGSFRRRVASPWAMVSLPLATLWIGGFWQQMYGDTRSTAVTVIVMNGSTQAPPHGSFEVQAPSPSLLEAIERIRSRLPVATDFAKLYELFDELVAAGRDLWSSSEDGRNHDLLTVARAVAVQARPRFAPLTSACFEVQGTGFWHGMVGGVDGIACFFYDERAGLGLMAVTNPFDGSSETCFIRFTRVELPASSRSTSASAPN